MIDYAAGAAVGVCFAGLLVLLYRTVTALERTAGTSTRSAEHERRDYFALIQKLVEKRDVQNSAAVAQMHAEERVNRERLDSAVDREVVRGNGNIPNPFNREDLEYGTPEESMH